MTRTLLSGLGLDKYNRLARLSPALISVAPIFIVSAVAVPASWGFFVKASGFMAGCGLTYALMQVSRYLGRSIEKDLGSLVGRERTASLLSYEGSPIPLETRKRYHDYLKKHGVSIPSEMLAKSDPAASRVQFLSAVDWLLEHTRATASKTMLLDENISYGFRRNMLGIKPIALAIVIAAFFGNLIAVLVEFNWDRKIAVGLLQILLTFDLMFWIFLIRPKFVLDASEAYGRRLLAQCEAKSKGPSVRKARKE